jgi:hypothetical protein
VFAVRAGKKMLVTTLEAPASVQVVGSGADEAAAVAWLENDGDDCE